MQKEINILVIENRASDFNNYRRALGETLPSKHTNGYSLHLVNGLREFNADNSFDDEQESKIKKFIEEFDTYQIVLFDLLLRHNDEKWDDFKDNADLLLSIRIANTYRKLFLEKKKLVLFTTTYEYIKTRKRFGEFRDRNPKLIAKEWAFIHKPSYFKKSAPSLGTCPHLCDNFAIFNEGNCNLNTCFTYNLLVFYKSFLLREK